jgi:putative flippase GtrA
MISIVTGVAGRFGINPKEAERFFKFLVVGTIGFIVDFGVFNLLTDPFDHLLTVGTGLHNFMAGFGLTADQVSHLAPTFAGTISFIAAIISNFLWNRYWTYPDSRGKSLRRQFVMFTAVSLAAIVLRIPIISFTHLPFVKLVEGIPALAASAERIGENMALALSVLIIMFWNFFTNRYWTYNDVD